MSEMKEKAEEKAVSMVQTVTNDDFSKDPFIGTAGVKRDKTAIHGGHYSF
jgi:hypothetical protein